MLSGKCACCLGFPAWLAECQLFDYRQIGLMNSVPVRRQLGNTDASNMLRATSCRGESASIHNAHATCCCQVAASRAASRLSPVAHDPLHATEAGEAEPRPRPRLLRIPYFVFRVCQVRVRAQASSLETPVAERLYLSFILFFR